MGIRRNTILNIVGAVLPLPVSLLVVPRYIESIGEERYGVLALAWTLLGYFGVLDLGLSRATAQRIAALNTETPARRAGVFWTAISMNLILGVIGAIVLVPVCRTTMSAMFPVGAPLRTEALYASVWLGVALPSAMLTGVLSGTLQGRERFLEVSVIGASAGVLIQLAPLLLALKVGATLPIVLGGAVAVRGASTVALFVVAMRHVGRFQRPSFSPVEARLLLKFGGWVSVTSVLGPLMVYADRFVIGLVAGARSVSFYTVPFQLAERSAVIPHGLVLALFPRMARDSDDDSKRMMSMGAMAIVCAMTPVIVLMILAIYPFLDAWISDEFAREGAWVGVVLLCGFWVNFPARVPAGMLVARGRPDVVARLVVIELMIYVPTLWFCVVRWGALGAAVAFSMRAAGDAVVLFRIAGSSWREVALMYSPGLSVVIAIVLSPHTRVFDVYWVAWTLPAIAVAVWLSWVVAPSELQRAARMSVEKALRWKAMRHP